MKRKMKFSGGLYKFLDRSGVLVSGDDTAIKAAKREYWRLYKKNWRMNQKTINKAFTVVLSIQDYEWLGASAKAHKRTINNFLKQAAKVRQLIDNCVKGCRGSLFKRNNGHKRFAPPDSSGTPPDTT